MSTKFNPSVLWSRSGTLYTALCDCSSVSCPPHLQKPFQQGKTFPNHILKKDPLVLHQLANWCSFSSSFILTETKECLSLRNSCSTYDVHIPNPHLTEETKTQKSAVGRGRSHFKYPAQSRNLLINTYVSHMSLNNGDTLYVLLGDFCCSKIRA